MSVSEAQAGGLVSIMRARREGRSAADSLAIASTRELRAYARRIGQSVRWHRRRSLGLFAVSSEMTWS